MKDSIEECFAESSRNNLTTNLSEESKAFVTRGITQKPEIDHCISKKRDFYFIDTGYFGNFPSPGNPGGKKKYHRIVKNNIQHIALKKNYPDDRWKNLVKSDPRLTWTGWKNFDKKILLVVPNPKACRFYGVDQEKWVDETIKTIKLQTSLPIEIRIKGSRSYRNKEYTIYDAFNSGVMATVAFNSIAALESVLYGIPAFVNVPCAAAPLSNMTLDLSTPIRPDLNIITSYCHQLAYGQFTQDEIENGTAWNILGKFE